MHECYLPLEMMKIGFEVVRSKELGDVEDEVKRSIAWGITGEMLSDGRIIECPEHPGRYGNGGEN